MPVAPAVCRQRQEDHKVKVNLGNRARPIGTWGGGGWGDDMKENKARLNKLTHACNPSMWEVEAGRSKVMVILSHTEFNNSLGL